MLFKIAGLGRESVNRLIEDLLSSEPVLNNRYICSATSLKKLGRAQFFLKFLNEVDGGWVDAVK